MIGRHPSCDILLAGQSVSRRHAALRFKRRALDRLGSRLPQRTRINGERVQRCEVRAGDVLLVGPNRLRID
ncbi:MAG: FHA domain-containing protein [Solirubrobacteraceae bacterium]